MQGATMQLLTSPADIAALRSAGQHPDPLLDLAERRMTETIEAFREAGWEWTADEFGLFVLIEAGDDVRDLHEAGLNPEERGLLGAVWEACHKHEEAGAYDVFVLFGNDGGNSFLVPAAPWLDPELRAKLDAEATPPPLAAAGAEGVGP